MSHELCRLFARPFAGLRAVLVWALLAHVQLSHAQTAVDASYDRFRAVITGNTAAIAFGSDGSALAVPKSSGMGYVSKGLTPTSGELSRFAALGTKYGELPFKVSQTFTSARLAKGIGAIAGGPLGIGLLALELSADWLSDAGVNIDPTTGAARSMNPGDIVCSMPTPGGVPRPGRIWHANTGNAVGEWCGEGLEGYPSFVSAQGTIVSVGAPSLGDMLTPAQVETKLNNTPRTTSEIEKILSETIKYPEIQPDPVDWVRIDPVNPGDYIKTPTKTDQKTTTNPDGSKVEETKSCWIKGTVQTGASMKLSEVCNTDTVTKSPSGTVTGTATAVTVSERAAAATPVKPSDFCASLLGKLICADMDTPDDDVPEREETVTYEAEDLGFGDGHCPPPFTWNDTAGAHEIDLSPYCDKLKTVVKPLVILFALLAAFFIVAPGKTEAA